MRFTGRPGLQRRAPGRGLRRNASSCGQGEGRSPKIRLKYGHVKVRAYLGSLPPSLQPRCSPTSWALKKAFEVPHPPSLQKWRTPRAEMGRGVVNKIKGSFESPVKGAQNGRFHA